MRYPTRKGCPGDGYATTEAERLLQLLIRALANTQAYREYILRELADE